MRQFIIRLTSVATLALAAVPVIGLTQAAQAGEAAELQMRVAIGDLNLSRPAQAAVLEARIETASATFCKDLERRSVGGSRMPRAACANAVRAEVLRQLPKADREAVRFAARAKSVDVATW